MTGCGLAVRTSNVTIANACVEILAGAFRACTIREIQISLVAATASVFGLGRPAAKGITPTTPVAVLMDGGGANSDVTTIALAWGTGPTVPTSFIRRTSLGAVIGPMVPAWTFPGGLVIPAGGSLVIWNLTATSVADVNVVTSE
jgi:hypothetical protein